jgi:rare lipoprotein A
MAYIPSPKATSINTPYRLAWALAVGTLLAACSTVPYAPPATQPPQAKPIQSAPAQSFIPSAPAPGNRPKGGGYYLDDGPGDNIPPNLADIPDAVPRTEPLKAASNRPYAALGTNFTPLQSVQAFTQTGVGSWYGKKFHGVKTSSGEFYDMYAMTAAHPTLPIPSYARVTNLANGRSVVVRVNDRGPFLHSRIIDLSYAAAWKLGYVDQGSARLQVDAIIPDELDSFFSNLNTTTTPTSSPPTASLSAAQTTNPAPLTASPVTPGEGATSELSGVFLQLGAFSSAANADSFRDYAQNELKWLQQNIHTELINGRYRLQVGPFRDTDQARSIGEKISAQIRVQAFLVRR